MDILQVWVGLDGYFPCLTKINVEEEDDPTIQLTRPDQVLDKAKGCSRNSVIGKLQQVLIY